MDVYKVRFANADMNPLCGVTVDGNEDNDRQLILGSYDVYVRQTDDDGREAPDRCGEWIDGEIVSVSAAELARLRAIEDAARALYNNGGGDDSDGFTVRYAYVDALHAALTTPNAP